MNPLAYFTLELMHQHRRETERATRLRRRRVGDDEPLADIRDRRWADAIHRFATGEPEARSAESRTELDSTGQAHSTGRAQPST